MRSDLSSSGDEKGIALIAALGITLVLTLLAFALAYRSGLFVMSSRSMLVKSQDLYTTEVGLNEMRHFLWENECVPPSWLCLPNLSDTNNPAHTQYNRYIDYSPVVRALFNQQLQITDGLQKVTYTPNGDIVYETTTAPSAEFDRYRYQVFAKATSVPKTIGILSTSERPGQQSRTIVEATLIFDDSGYGYEQKSQSLSKGGKSAEVVESGGAPVEIRTKF